MGSNCRQTSQPYLGDRSDEQGNIQGFEVAKKNVMTDTKRDYRGGYMENRLIRLETIIEQMATKEDIANLRTEIMREMGRLENGMLKWGVGLVISNIGIAIAISFTAQKLMG